MAGSERDKISPMHEYIPLHCAKNDLKQLILNIKRLEDKKVELKEGIGKFSEEIWNEKINNMNSIKFDIKEKLNTYNGKVVHTLEKLLKRRIKKRLRIRRRKSRLQSKRKNALIQRKELHKMIDRALEVEKLKIWRGKQTKEAANYAELVLSNVTRKKADAQHYIQLFNSLKDLRKARKTATQRNDTDSGYEFDSKVNRLVAVWNDALEEYENEENKLKSILKDAHKSTEDQWHEVLFGEKHKDSIRFDSSNARDFNKFLEIRHIWDSCIVPNECEYGSYIPTGWILPPENPLPAWKLYRK